MSNYEIFSVLLNMLFGLVTTICMIVTLVLKTIQFVNETKNDRTPSKS